ncbi:DNA repair protein RecN [Minwuia thermotolerans]|uniref:DNA repair protein RecN n=1 Tax=Minwuia thermotolerans TaxID=2056226 RepID=A0A2M9G234_9PROT|nr:DNA repair protein RecN [Minwuia thermotolerans]PJK29778.1 DNA repair protein RecN [Minwuia thermotolerans]
MLRSLSIRDIVVFDRLDIDLAGGLCALTGETGAGKSILLDSLGLAIGQRAEGRLVRSGADRGAVIAVFELPGDHPAQELLREQEIEPEDQLIVRRTLSADGRSRAFVNDQPVSVGFLARLGETIVEVHGQAAEVGLMKTANHRGILDRFAGNDARLAAVARTHAEWRRLEKAHAARVAEVEKARAEQDFLEHALAELEELAPEPGEEERLAERRGFLMQVEKIAEAVSDAVGALEDEGGVASRLRAAERALDRVRDRAAGRLEAALDALARAAVEADEAVNAISAVAADLDAEPGELERVDERLFALRGAARKHRVEAAGLPELLERYRSQLAAIEGGGRDIERLASEAQAARETYLAAAETLSAARREAAGRLDEAVRGELEPLRMGGARFLTGVAPLGEQDWGAQGADQVRFEVATNPGAEPGPIAKIASGGELSRFMLALKVVLAGSGDAPVLIFDEVDRGVGGATADAVGERLQRLAGRFQVLVVTHSPQVAARAGRQWLIAKDVSDRATTRVVRLESGERREEIARMLSGAEITAEARAAADKLLSGRQP